MKKVKYFFGLVLTVVFLSTGVLYSQNTMISRKEKRNLEHLRKKKNNKLDRSLSREYYTQLLQKKYFVFTADFAMNDEGYTFVTDPEINFLSVIGKKLTFQFGRNGRIGLNGVGGVTLRGQVVDYKFSPGTKKRGMIVTSDAQLNGPIMPPRFVLYVSDDGTAQLNLTLGNGETISYSGRVYSPQNSGIYQGTSLF
ncbi:MAG: DUF4251 domain-containing protein [Bacteroidales bacterium]|nr:DUF4251 domain-containing protein [Bacteroidales bacterium]